MKIFKKIEIAFFFSSKLFPSSKIDFLAIFEIAKHGKQKFMKLIYLISRFFLAWSFLNFLAHCGGLENI